MNIPFLVSVKDRDEFIRSVFAGESLLEHYPELETCGVMVVEKDNGFFYIVNEKTKDIYSDTAFFSREELEYLHKGMTEDTLEEREKHLIGKSFTVNRFKRPSGDVLEMTREYLGLYQWGTYTLYLNGELVLAGDERTVTEKLFELYMAEVDIPEESE